MATINSLWSRYSILHIKFSFHDFSHSTEILLCYYSSCLVFVTYKLTWIPVCVIAPLPMEDIAKMADECMKDVDEDEDEDNLEDDEDLLVSVCLYSSLLSLWLHSCFENIRHFHKFRIVVLIKV